jgi:hypothetical protein
MNSEHLISRAKNMKPGDPVFITDQSHPWCSHFGTVISGEETYGLGWKGYRVQLADNCGETYVRPDQTMGPGRVDSMTMTTRRRPGGGKHR